MCQSDVMTLLAEVLPELGIITVNGDSLRYVKGVFKDKLHVLSRTQAGVQQVLRGDGLTQHVGDALCLGAVSTRFEPGFLSLILPQANKQTSR